MDKKAFALIIILVFLLGFPLAYIGLLIWSGNAQLVLKKDVAGAIRVENQQRIQKESEDRDKFMKESSLAFLANAEEAKRLEEKEERIRKEQERLEVLKAEIEQAKAALEERQQEFVAALKDGSDVDKKRIKKLAKVYEAMDSEEAARLMETLDDSLCIRIFNNMSEVRQKADIMAVMNGEKASRLSKQMGVELKNKN